MTQSFSDAGNTQTTAVTAAKVTEDGSIIVGDKVFTPEALAKKLQHQDTHIANLEAENTNHVESSSKLLDRLDQIEKKVTDKDDLTSLLETMKQNNTSNQEPPNTETEGTQPLSKEELVAAAVSTMNAQSAEQAEEDNLNKAVAAAKESYGDDFSTKIDSIGASLGMNVEAVIKMAKTQPSAWAKLFIPVKNENGSPDPTKTSSLPGLTPPPATEKRGGYVAMRSNKDQRAEFKRRMDAALNPKQ